MSVRSFLVADEQHRAHDRLKAVLPRRCFLVASQKEIEADAEIKSYSFKPSHKDDEEDEHVA